MNEIIKVRENNKEILVVDYCGCSEGKMLELISECKAVLSTAATPQLLLSIYNDKTYATPRFMRRIEEETPNVDRFIAKQAVVGLSKTKKIILKGYNFLFKRNIKAFDTREEAIKFLVDDQTSDRDIPEYLKEVRRDQF